MPEAGVWTLVAPWRSRDHPPAAGSWLRRYIGIATAAIALLQLGCSPAAIGPHDPEVIGVVTAREFIGSRTARYELTGGESVDIDLNAVHSLRPGGPEADVGDLLVYGVADSVPWYVAVRPTPAGFELRTAPAKVDANVVLFDFGLRLQRDANYHESGGQLEGGAAVSYILGENGEVKERR